MLTILLGPSARKFLKRASKALYARLMQRIRKLAKAPFPSDAKRVVSKKDKVFRIRIGDYRIQYAVFYEKQELLVSDIDKRPRAY